MKRPVLRYYGGKFMLAPWIISHFPAHRTYVEPYAGAASVLMLKPRAYSEVYNDQWSEIVSVFRILRDPELAAELERLLRLTPFSREEFEAPWPLDLAPLERARRLILRSFAGHGSGATNVNYPTGFRANSDKQYSTPAHDWARYPDHIRLFTDRLRGVIVENRPALEVIAQHDKPDTLFYVDPPYPHTTRNMNRGNAEYVHEMRDEDHAELAGALHACAGMVALSGYACELYDGLYADWERREVNAWADGRRPRVEVLWLNRAAACRQRQGSLL